MSINMTFDLWNRPILEECRTQLKGNSMHILMDLSAIEYIQTDCVFPSYSRSIYGTHSFWFSVCYGEWTFMLSLTYVFRLVTSDIWFRHTWLVSSFWTNYNVFLILTYLLTGPVGYLSCGDEVGLGTTCTVTSRGWGQHVEIGAGTGWGWGLRHTVRGSNGIKSLLPCHSLPINPVNLVIWFKIHDFTDNTEKVGSFSQVSLW